MQSEIFSNCTVAQSLNKIFQIPFTELLHTSFSQQVIGLSIACRENGGAHTNAASIGSV